MPHRGADISTLAIGSWTCSSSSLSVFIGFLAPWPLGHWPAGSKGSWHCAAQRNGIHYAFVVIRHGGGVAKVKKCRISWLAFVYYYDWSRGQPFVPRENTSKVDKIDIEGLGRWWSSSWSNSACERARDLIFF